METKQISVWGRIGYFLLAILPPIAFLGIQVVAGVIVVFFAMFLEFQNLGSAVLNGNVTEVTAMLLEKYAAITVFASHLTTIPIMAVWYKFSFKKPRPKLFCSFKKVGLISCLAGLVLGVVTCFIANGIEILEYFFLPTTVLESFERLAETAGLGTNIVTILSAVFLAPISEELVCRGLVLNFSRKAFGKFWIANIIQALTFGLLHANWVQGIYAFVIGLVFGYLVKVTGSVIPSIFAHFAVNGSSSTWIGLVFKDVPSTLPLGIMLAVIPWAVVIVLFVWLKKRNVEGNGVTE